MKSKIIKMINSKSKKKRDFETKFLDLCRQVQQTKKRKSKASTKEMSDSSIYDTLSDEKIASLGKIPSLEKVASLEKVMPVIVEKKKETHLHKEKQTGCCECLRKRKRKRC